MTIEKVSELLRDGEGIDIEFKSAGFELNMDVFDSICSFLNRKGGHLLLGVNDKGNVDGVLESCIPGMINNLVTSANNPGKLFPTVYLSPEVLDYEGKKIVYCYVPESPQVHNTNGKVYDRNGDGDIDITRQPFLMTNLYMRKQSIRSEDWVCTYVELADLKMQLFKRIRQLIRIRQPEHPWIKMSPMDIVRSAGLYKMDPGTGKSGMTLAAVLLFGKDETIMNVLSHHKTDALKRVENLDRYDDRDDIRTNLIDSFDRLMAFIAKHLPDKFYLEGVISISLRDRLFREIISNLLIHREYSNRFPAKLIIEGNRVYTENWTLPHGWGEIDPLNFAPFPKNPVIAKFFKIIGRADELGSGVRNVFRYAPEYTRGARPELIEGDVFKTIIPLRSAGIVEEKGPSNWLEVRDKVRSKFGIEFGINPEDSSEKILELILENGKITAMEMAEKINISSRMVEKQLAKLKNIGILERVGSRKAGNWRVRLGE